VFVSRSQEAPEKLWKMTLETDKEDVTIEEASSEEGNLLLSDKNGTTVILYEVDNDIMKLFLFHL